MKKYINYINAIVGCCLLAACNELDTQPFESYDENTVWGSTESAASFVINSYNGTVTNFVGYAYMESLTPNSIHSDLTTLDGFPIERVDRFTSTAQGLDNYFANLRNCNLIIEKAPNQALKAEGYLLRGLLFFNQTRWQGRFVPILRVLNTKSNEAFRMPYTQNPTESYRYIMSDLTKAAEEMPETSAPGRANKYVAHAFRSRIALQAYAYTKDAQYLDIAIASANAVINSGKYTLASADNFGNMFLPAGQNDREIILGHYRLKLNTSVANFNEMIRVVPNINNNEVRAVGGRLFTDAKGRTFEGWASYFPTQDLIDQYLVAAEEKWKIQNGLVMLLPHGMEGQGAEHSSARLERFLTLCANENIFVANCTTPANYFHLLRRQMKQPFRKPLVVMTPKSLLRHPKVVSGIEEMANGEFQTLIDDTLINAEKVERIALCSGKIYYELLAKREEINEERVALVRLEQLYPLDRQTLAGIMNRYAHNKEIVWVQEEPKLQDLYSVRIRWIPVRYIFTVRK